MKNGKMKIFLVNLIFFIVGATTCGANFATELFELQQDHINLKRAHTKLLASHSTLREYLISLINGKAVKELKLLNADIMHLMNCIEKNSLSAEMNILPPHKHPKPCSEAIDCWKKVLASYNRFAEVSKLLNGTMPCNYDQFMVDSFHSRMTIIRNHINTIVDVTDYKK